MTARERARAELIAAVVAGLLAIAVALDGARAWLREDRIREASAEALGAAAADRPEVALKASLRALAEDPERPALRALAASLHLRAGQLEPAERRYRALAEAGDDEEAVATGHLGLAIAALERARGDAGRGAEAGQRLDPAIEGQLAKAGRARRLAVQAVEGALELQAGRPEAALDRLGQALADPGGQASRDTLLALHANLALAATRAGRYERAATERARAALLSGNQRARVVAYAEALARWIVRADGAEAAEAARGAATEAIRAAGRSDELAFDLDNVDVALVYEALGLAQVQAGALEEAVPTLAQALSRARSSDRQGAPSPVQASVRWNLGATHLRRLAAATRPQERREQARFAAQHLFDAGELLEAAAPERAFAAFLAAGLGHRIRESPGDAVKVLERALALRPSDVRALAALGLVYDTWGRKGQPKEAIAWYRRAAEAAPDDPLGRAAAERAKALEGRR